MSTALKLEKPDEMEALRAEAAATRQALRQKEQRVEFLENCLQNMTHQIVKVHEQYGGWLGRMQEQVNEVALAASLIPGILSHKDQIANYAQGLPSREEFELLRERVEGLAARESV